MERYITPGPTVLRPLDVDYSQLLEGHSEGGKIVGVYRADAHDRTPYGLLAVHTTVFGVFASHAAARTAYHAYRQWSPTADPLIVLTRYTKPHQNIGDQFEPFYADSTDTMDLVQRVGGRFWYIRRNGYTYVVADRGRIIQAVMVAGESVARAVAELLNGEAIIAERQGRLF